MEIEKINDIPCVPDCDERKQGCHAYCKKYIEFDLKQEEKRKKRVLESSYNGYIADQKGKYEKYQQKHKGGF